MSLGTHLVRCRRQVSSQRGRRAWSKAGAKRRQLQLLRVRGLAASFGRQGRSGESSSSGAGRNGVPPGPSLRRRQLCR
eukprot:9189491-Pyramimonas_sp.AAC.1